VAIIRGVTFAISLFSDQVYGAMAGEDHPVRHVGARGAGGDRFEATFKREIDRRRIFCGLRGEA